MLGTCSLLTVKQLVGGYVVTNRRILNLMLFYFVFPSYMIYLCG